MKPGGGARKGGAYEREVCERLSRWVSGGARQDLFWRASMSGGRANLKQRRKRAGAFAAHAGDIVATHNKGHLLIDKFCIDAKHWRKFELDAPAFGKRPGMFLEAWKKLSEEATRFGKWPMLIGRQNRRGEFVALSPEGLMWLAKGIRPGTDMTIRMTIPRTDCPSVFFVSFDDIEKRVVFDSLRIAPKGRRPRVRIAEEE